METPEEIRAAGCPTLSKCANAPSDDDADAEEWARRASRALRRPHCCAELSPRESLRDCTTLRLGAAAKENAFVDAAGRGIAAPDRPLKWMDRGGERHASTSPRRIRYASAHGHKHSSWSPKDSRHERTPSAGGGGEKEHCKLWVPHHLIMHHM